jgi:hypothetical protein
MESQNPASGRDATRKPAKQPTPDAMAEEPTAPQTTRRGGARKQKPVDELLLAAKEAQQQVNTPQFVSEQPTVPQKMRQKSDTGSTTVVGSQRRNAIPPQPVEPEPLLLTGVQPPQFAQRPTVTPPPSFPQARPVRLTGLLERVSKLPPWLTGIVLFLLGVLLGGLIVVIYLSVSADRPLLNLPRNSTVKSSIVVRLNATYLGQVIQKQSDANNKLSNVQVQIKKDQPINVEADNETNVIGVGVKQHVTMVVQPYIDSCKLKIRIVRANTGGIPATAFAETLEQNVNRQLSGVQGQLPTGFTYCATAVNTEDDVLAVQYVATPIP